MRYIALHHHPDVPLDRRIVGYEGVWISSELIALNDPPVIHLPYRAYAVPTGRAERRDDDGETAEVWEIHLVSAGRSSLVQS